MEHQLIAHALTPPGIALALSASVVMSCAGCLDLNFSLSGAIDSIQMPPMTDGERMDGLWQTTCFEAFLLYPDRSYVELNLSPSRNWAAYRFDGYRTGMQDAVMVKPPLVEMTTCDGRLQFKARCELGALLSEPAKVQIGLSAVVEELNGHKSYWALVHPAAKPDFHDPQGFILNVQGA